MLPNEMIAAAITRERTHAGLSLSALAARAGIAKSTLSQLESGKGNPSIETLWSLASALDIPFSCLFETPARAVTLIRAGEGAMLASDQANIAATLLSASGTAERRDLYRMELEPGPARQSCGHPAGNREHAVVCSGRARLGPDGSTADLDPGDYYAYPADVPHSYTALAPGTVVLLVMESRR